MSISSTPIRTILILAANPKGTNPRRLQQEVRDINEGLQRSQHRDSFSLEQRWAVRTRDIQRAILDTNPSIVHFSGYGEGNDGLAFEDEAGDTQLVDTEALAGLFKLFSDQVECVVLNACYSEVQAEAIAQYIPYVIGMRQVEDSSALEFSVAFYDALCAGRGIHFAYELGCNAIRMSGTREVILPVLKQNLNRQFSRIDWGEAIDVSIFYGRSEELMALKQWVLIDRCRLIALLGMGGIGKTSLTAKLGEQLQYEFEYVIWRSLKDAPPLKNILISLIQFLSNQQENEINLPEQINACISRLLYYLRRNRCLLILDNVESILREGQSGIYREGHEAYGELLRRIGESSHQSCLILTSREKPKELATLAGATLPVRCWQTNGIEDTDGQAILRAKGLNLAGVEEQSKDLISWYGGNPLALKLIATTIQTLFDGNIVEFLKLKRIAFGGVHKLLDEQFQRLSYLEKSVMYWLAVNREPVSLEELQDDIVPPVTENSLLEALEALVGRSLIETSAAEYTQQSVVMEYVAEQLINHICEEVRTGPLDLLNRYPLIKATAKDFIRDAQIRLFLKPVTDKIAALKPWNEIKSELPVEVIRLSEYGAGNVINLLVYLQRDLSGFDLSNLTIWQAFFKDVNLQRVNLRYSDLRKSIFTATLAPILSISFSLDGYLLATGDESGEVNLWQIATSQKLYTFKGHTRLVRAIAFSPNSQVLASGSYDGTIRLWNFKTLQLDKILEGSGNAIHSIAFSPNGRILVGGNSDSTISLWDTSTGELLNILHGHANRVNAVTFDPSGRILVSGSGDRTVKLWNVQDIQNIQCLETLNEYSNEIRSIAISPTGRVLACSSGDLIKLWNIQDLQNIQYLNTLLGHTNEVRSIAFNSNGDILASGSGDQVVRLWDMRNTQNIQCINILQGHTSWIQAVAFNPNNGVLASAGVDRVVKLWDIRISGETKCIATWRGYSKWIRSVAFNPDDKIIASGDDDRVVRLWTVDSEQPRAVLQEHTERVHSIAFSPNGQSLISGSWDKTVKLWDVNTGKYQQTFLGHTDQVYSVAFSPIENIAASGSDDKTVRIWNVSLKQCHHVLYGHEAQVYSVAFSPNGRIIASGSRDTAVKLWDVESGQCLATLQGHEREIYMVAFNPTKQILASCSGDNTIRLWSLIDYSCSTILQDHEEWVYSIAFSPSGNILASASGDRTVRLWDLESKQCLSVLQGHENLVHSVAFNSDGSVLISGGGDETIRLWDVQTGKNYKTLQAPRPYEGMNITGARGLTEAQKATLIELGAVLEN